VEKLFGKYPKASRARFFGGKKRPIAVSLAPLERLRNPISGLIPIFQTVSEGEFSEAELPLYGVLGSTHSSGTTPMGILG
jgi:hypothetical protein